MRAAMALARCDRDVASEILVSAVTVDDAVVRLGVVRALGMVGGMEAVKTIDRVMPELNGRVRDQAMFARTLIAHRHGQAVAAPATYDANPLEPARDCGRPVRIRPSHPGMVEQCLTSIGSWPYGIEVDDRSILEYQCDRSTGAILLNRALAGRDAMDRLLARPALAGLEARKDKATGRYSVSLVILTTPSEEGIDIRVHLTNGTLLFTGHGGVRGGEAHWILRAIQRAGAFPFRASGTFAGERLVIEGAESGARVLHQLRPSLIDIGTLRVSRRSAETGRQSS
jgi:hypothetical protein